MANYNSTLQTNNTDLQAILNQINELPEAGGKDPVLQDKTVTPTTNSQTITADSGYDGLDTVTVKAMPTATQATPSITVSSAGKITASATQTAGYVVAGTKSATKQLTTQAAKTVTPTKSSQTAVAKNVYTTGAVTVAAIPAQYITTTDATAAAADMRSGKTAYVNGAKVTGTMPNNGAISSTMNGVDTKSVSIPAGYTSGGTVGLDDTIDNELDAQAALLEEIMTTLESKAAPDSGGGVSVEVCNGIIVVDAPNMEDFTVYALNSSLVTETISIDAMMGGTFSVAKGTIMAVTPWTSTDSISGECVKCFDSSYDGAAFLVNGDFTLTFA